ncbi:MAG: response regulator transcription factor, partial [Firmicutes bacterium]|nr:response regulator transcription factor [Bacillota bacterium]
MDSKITILLIEDEASISKLISKLLTAQNYKVLSTASAKDGLSIITSHCPDVVILDLGLPDMDGLDVLREVRSWSSLPIIVVSARTQEKEKVLALDLGADDYISKPFGNAELLARVRTVIRHSNKLNTTAPLYKRPYYAKGLKIDFEKHLVTVNDVPVHLTQIEFKIISLLAQNSGSVITYSNIIS